MGDIRRPSENSYWVVPGALLAGEYPGAPWTDAARAKIRAHLDAGVTYFVDLTSPADPLEDYDELLHAEARQRGVEVVYSNRPIVDLNCPTETEMRAILDEIDAAIARGHIVYVHCWGGVGRTGTVVGCHLVRRGMSGDAALAEVERLFASMSPLKQRAHPRGSPEMPGQREFVRQWVEKGSENGNEPR